jgi:hypothetical protein
LDSARAVAAIAESEARVDCGCGNGEFHTTERAPTKAPAIASPGYSRSRVFAPAGRVERRLNAIVDRKIETTSELDGMWQIFRCWTRLERFEIGQRPTRDVVNNLQELRRRQSIPSQIC